MIAVVALAPIAYLLGTFPTAVLVARAAGRDVLGEGSGNPGASNTFRLLGWKAGAVVLAGDAAKGALPAAAGLELAGHPGGYLLGAAAVAGHVFPWPARRRGGRGVATAAGMAFVLYPLVALALAGLWVVVAVGLRRASVASLLAAVLTPVLVWWRGESPGDVAATTALATLVVVRHRTNLARLLRGSEPTLDHSPPASDHPTPDQDQR
jgi:glycerol-3-phosphate acyltransferase PlsY